MSRTYVWRYAGFVIANMAVVGGLSYVVWENIPPLQEIPWFTVVPINVIALLAFLGLYPVVRRQRPGLGRLMSLYGAFVATFAVYGLFLAIAFPVLAGGSVWINVVGSIALGHFYGVPVLGICALVNGLLTRTFFPRPLPVVTPA